jgi:ribosomal protein S18 acetylase RimI-like enzyme
MTFRALSAEMDLTPEVPFALPWVHAAGQPYIDWLLGGRAAAVRALERWMSRPSSEVFIGRAVLLLVGTRPVGGFIALHGEELARCRMQDALAAVAATPPEQRSALISRLKAGHSLFEDVSPDELYLSRMGVLAAARGRGYGRAIVLEHLQDGMQRGFRRFSLDVWAGNTAAIRLYESVGFHREARYRSDAGGMTYLRMAHDVPAEQEHETRDPSARPTRSSFSATGRPRKAWIRF